VNIDLSSLTTLQAPSSATNPQAGPGGPPGTTTEPPASGTEQELRDQLKNAGISFDANVCQGERGKPCTNSPCVTFEGLPDSAISGMKNLASAAGTFYVTGGAEECGHKSHGSGVSNVDIDKPNSKLLSYFQDNASKTGTAWGSYSCFVIDGSAVIDEGNHWHVEFGNPTDCK